MSKTTKSFHLKVRDCAIRMVLDQKTPVKCKMTLVTTKTFLSRFGMASLRDLPDIEALEDAGLLSKGIFLAGDIPVAMGDQPEDDEDDAEIDHSEIDPLPDAPD
jgi:hypothetical protein